MAAPIKLRFRAVAFALAVLGPVEAAQATSWIDDYSSLLVLGDSLSDTGNVDDVSFGLIPGADYFEGRFSNGLVWSDYYLQAFEDNGKFAANVAYGGAKTVDEGGFIDLFSDLPEQIDNVVEIAKDAPIGQSPLLSFWFGGNDIFDAVETPDPIAVAQGAALNIAKTVADFFVAGVNDFLVFNLPDLGQTPRYALFEPENQAIATQATLAFNADLKMWSDVISDAGANLMFVDIAAVDLASVPGVTDVTLPCLFPDQPTATAFGQPELCTGAAQSERAFFDEVHPNATAHIEIALLVNDILENAASASIVSNAVLSAAPPASFSFQSLPGAGVGPLVSQVPVPASAPLLGFALACAFAFRTRGPVV